MIRQSSLSQPETSTTYDYAIPSEVLKKLEGNIAYLVRTIKEQNTSLVCMGIMHENVEKDWSLVPYLPDSLDSRTFVQIREINGLRNEEYQQVHSNCRTLESKFQQLQVQLATLPLILAKVKTAAALVKTTATNAETASEIPDCERIIDEIAEELSDLMEREPNQNI